ncbi:MAG: type II toxin-antitoxin system VapB family antitoxin [Spirochaetaceae bacterium]|jgi:hypothetical protein|nr:type II toxin-antitoxin system VapB family antitoxin [Spirochaetaceae bacterium]
MTATIELNDRKWKRAQKLTGIDDAQKLVKVAVERYIRGAELRDAAHKALKTIGDENPFFEGYDPKA